MSENVALGLPEGSELRDAFIDTWYYIGQASGLREAAKALRAAAGNAFAEGADDRAKLLRAQAKDMEDRAAHHESVSRRAKDRVAAIEAATQGAAHHMQPWRARRSDRRGAGQPIRYLQADGGFLQGCRRMTGDVSTSLEDWFRCGGKP